MASSISRTFVQLSLLLWIVCECKETATTVSSAATTFESDEINSTETTSTFCDANITGCANITEIPNITTATPQLSTTITPERKKPQQKKFRGNELCVCDLELNVCDINCCCDEDCSQNDRSIFSHCETEPKTYDTRYCSYVKHIYVNNTPFEYQVNQNGLFCVIKSNLPPSYVLQKEEPLLTFNDGEKEKRGKFSWRNYDRTDETKFNSSEKFIYGKNVWIVTKKGIEKLRIPQSLFTNRCSVYQDVYNFENVYSACVQTEIGRENTNLNLNTYFEDKFLIAASKFVNLTSYKRSIFQDCPRNVCLPITAKICTENWTDCKSVSGNDSIVVVTCNIDIRHNRNACVNVVKKIEYKVYHNGSNGYTKMEVLAQLVNVSYSFEDTDFEFKQEFYVSFLWMNRTRNFSTIQSGSPGYLIGKPLKIGKLINAGVKIKIERDPFKYRDNFLTLPDNVKGLCVSDNITFYSIEFGYNVLTKCRMRSQVLNLNKSVNGTEICRSIQNEVLKLWSADNENLTVGMFGNSNDSRPEDWWKILYNTPPPVLLNSTKGSFNTKTNHTQCTGLTTHIVISVFHSRIDIGTLKNQEKILGVTFAFAGIVNKTFSYHKNIVKFELDIKSEVTFYDISAEKRIKFAEPPSIDIKLPYDFFYPFVKIDNGVGNVQITAASWMVVVCLILEIF